MTICWPVMAAASGDSKKAVSAATSSGVTKRPIGGFFGAEPARSGSCRNGVSVAAGATTLTVIARGASSIAHERAMPKSAALSPHIGCAAQRRRLCGCRSERFGRPPACVAPTHPRTPWPRQCASPTWKSHRRRQARRARRRACDPPHAPGHRAPPRFVDAGAARRRRRDRSSRARISDGRYKASRDRIRSRTIPHATGALRSPGRCPNWSLR